jgi:ribonucleoside-diphosphate reductase alpha chain
MNSPLPRGVREPLPNRKRCVRQKATINGSNIYVDHGRTYPDGRAGEVFVDLHRDGAMVRSLMGCFSTAISLALQYGVPLEEIVAAFKGKTFEPNGAVKGNGCVSECTSLVDYVMRELEATYLLPPPPEKKPRKNRGAA